MAQILWPRTILRMHQTGDNNLLSDIARYIQCSPSLESQHDRVDNDQTNSEGGARKPDTAKIGAILAYTVACLGNLDASATRMLFRSSRFP